VCNLPNDLVVEQLNENWLKTTMNWWKLATSSASSCLSELFRCR